MAFLMDFMDNLYILLIIVKIIKLLYCYISKNTINSMTSCSINNLHYCISITSIHIKIFSCISSFNTVYVCIIKAFSAWNMPFNSNISSWQICQKSPRSMTFSYFKYTNNKFTNFYIFSYKILCTLYSIIAISRYNYWICPTLASGIIRIWK